MKDMFKRASFMIDLAKRRVSVKRGLLSLLLAALASVVLTGLIALGSNPVAAGSVELMLLGRGTFVDDFTILKVRKPIDAAAAAITFPPGSDTGWHYHPGPAVVIVKTGTLTRYLENGCPLVYGPGSVFVEEENHVHLVRNESGEMAESLATFTIPPGSPIKIPAANPGNVCKEDKGENRQER